MARKPREPRPPRIVRVPAHPRDETPVPPDERVLVARLPLPDYHPLWLRLGELGSLTYAIRTLARAQDPRGTTAAGVAFVLQALLEAATNDFKHGHSGDLDALKKVARGISKRAEGYFLPVAFPSSPDLASLYAHCAVFASNALEFFGPGEAVQSVLSAMAEYSADIERIPLSSGGPRELRFHHLVPSVVASLARRQKHYSQRDLVTECFVAIGFTRVEINRIGASLRKRDERAAKRKTKKRTGE